MNNDMDWNIACVFGGGGFPFGLAPTIRIRLISRIFTEYGFKVTVLHCGSSPWEQNNKKRGEYENIYFEYTTGVLKRPDNRYVRYLLYGWGIIILIYRLLKLKLRYPNRLGVFLSSTGDLIAIVTCLICKFLCIPIVKDLCEWWPGVPEYPKYKKYLFFHPLMETVRNFVVISTGISERIKLSAGKKPINVFYLPILVDANRLVKLKENTSSPFIMWSGDIDSYRKEVEFLIRISSGLSNKGYQFDLVITGKCGKDTIAALHFYARKRGFHGLIIKGFLSEETLLEYQSSASALLLPLWNDQRSITRFPTKLGEYLLTGCPVIISSIGEPKSLLKDNYTAFLCNPDDEESFAEKICCVLDNPELARLVGENGRKFARNTFDFHAYVQDLGKFMMTCIKNE